MRDAGFFDEIKPRLVSLGKCQVRIGTSGYVFADWRGTFYPTKLPQAGWLDYYAQEFDVVEINATYYRLPPARIFQSMARRTPNGFGFWVKLPGGITHGEDEPAPLLTAFRASIRPLIESGQYCGALAQFPPWFRPCPLSFAKLALIAELSENPLAVEFRRAEWQNEEVYRFCKSHNIINASIDLPALEGLPQPSDIITGQAGYVRFHGRNKRAWFDRKAGDRYDYDYSQSELQEWLPHLKRMSEQVSTMSLFFNNCHAGQAVRSARMLRDLLQGEFATPEAIK